MELTLIVLLPQGPFGTPLRADTLWGHYAWQVAYDSELFAGGIDALIGAMRVGPRVVLGGPFICTGDDPAWYLPRPTLPLTKLFPGYLRSEEKKLLKRRRWLRITSFDEITCSAETLYEAPYLEGSHIPRTHNTISRLTGRTGSGVFAPFEEEEVWHRNIKWGILVSCEKSDLPGLIEGLTRIGKMGYGRNASTGSGRFSVKDVTSITLKSTTHERFVTLGPLVSTDKAINWSRSYCVTEVRFGRHGGEFAHQSRPFKAPLVFVKEGAVIEMNRPLGTHYIVGNVVDQISQHEPNTIFPGYSLVLPVSVPQL